ncbi:MAG: hypothetical protein HFI37_06590 [Lachnospiraceae bacterium]|nr:hypothetical protein [Lachnospiraceae bacterium]
MKKHKLTILTTALILIFSGAVGIGTFYMQKATETKVLAFDSSTTEDLSFSEINLSLAEELLEKMPNAPLLQENAKEDWGDSSLENTINDINADTNANAKKFILQVCKDAGIDANKATVSDLTAEQIAQIDYSVYLVSDHPKN